MRIIGYLDSASDARRFGDYLVVQGIANQVERDADGRWAVWVHSEDLLEKAAEALARFRENPADRLYLAAPVEAQTQRVEEAKAEARTRTRYVDARVRLGVAVRFRPGPLTLALIAGCIAIAVWSGLGTKPQVLNELYITSVKVADGTVEWDPSLPEIREGEIWRLFTSMFIHFGLMHLVFNLFWLNDLGSMIERRQSVLVLALLVLVSSAATNLAQYAASGPLSGGMSGVVYCLFGYVWLRGRFDPGSGLYASPPTVITMLVWFVLCLTGLLGPIGNASHAAGLAIGLAWGLVSSGRLQRGRM
jgi:GlpG protein